MFPKINSKFNRQVQSSEQFPGQTEDFKDSFKSQGMILGLLVRQIDNERKGLSYLSLPEGHQLLLIPLLLQGLPFLSPELLQLVQSGHPLASPLVLLRLLLRFLQVSPLVPLLISGVVSLSLNLQINHLEIL